MNNNVTSAGTKVDSSTKDELLTSAPLAANPMLCVVASGMIEELIKSGWEFMLHYGCHKTYCDIKEMSWEADFTKRKDNGLWDNHKPGYGTSPLEAIEKAYQNIKKGVRLKKSV